MEEQREFEIWVQGYAATGESGKAYMTGTGIGNTFDEAVQDYMSKNAEHGITKSRDGRWNIWACNLFDNEADARKAFG